MSPRQRLDPGREREVRVPARLRLRRERQLHPLPVRQGLHRRQQRTLRLRQLQGSRPRSDHQQMRLSPRQRTGQGWILC